MILVVIMASIVIQPLVELANLFREKVTLGSAVSNALRAARDRSLEVELLRGLDARVDEERFRDYFADAFEDTLNVSVSDDSGDEVTFISNDGKFNDFTVRFAFVESTDLNGRVVTQVNIDARSAYKFKTKALQLAEEAGSSGEVELISERTYLLSVRN
ncbi:hypothetical protein PAECIP111892_02964 [Paenibacillus auburnensis]|uniref:Uncharacterized protein n=1 Tax=Paenibacillus auburnensis TaxID=2905649 RepID=A0ABM9CC74_9BACL|nr:hypothetical protein [Paenibacillus auburnensis]CAH1207680.1 hypothetical protein PAECIP111892_02964 [Paenibacillus auburnensis]